MNNNYQRRIRGGLVRAAAVILALLLLQALHSTLALGIPPGGASPDTPGTYAEVYPKELQPGATIQFSVSGYPAGEVLNIKIDDGAGYSDGTQAGTGVVHTQVIGSNGSTSGSLRLPSDISEGWHWLRFLASQQVEGKGVLGFTNGAGSVSNTSHPTAFYVTGESLGGKTAEESVVPGTSPGNTTTTTTTTNGDASGGANNAAGSGDTPADTTDTDAAAMSDEEAAAAAEAALLAKDSLVADAGSATQQSTAASTPTATAANTGAPLPVPGLIVLGTVLIAGIAVLLVVALRRPRPAVASGPDGADSVGDGHSFTDGIGAEMGAGGVDVLDSFSDDFSDGPAPDAASPGPFATAASAPAPSGAIGSAGPQSA
jgi:hypothetical protein